MDGYEPDFGVDVTIDPIDVECEDFDVDPEGLGEEGEYDEEASEAGSPKRPKLRMVKGRPAKRPRVNAYMRWSLFSVNCCNALYLGYMALLCSMQVGKKLRKGDVEAARRCAGHACRTNVAAFLVTIVIVIVISFFMYNAYRIHNVLAF
ncbi:dispanin subfamily A member 2b-like [Anguilla rostrata]|uniref:dispanin subfamily A member 2b-like n=1 Tax=Anguilla rostrata TaxID=7938 RepID=UPI0030D3F785